MNLPSTAFSPALLLLTCLGFVPNAHASFGLAGLLPQQPTDSGSLLGGKPYSHSPEQDAMVYRGAWKEGTTSLTQVGDVWSFRYQNGAETSTYQLDLSDPDVRKGLIIIKHVESNSFPVYGAGASWRSPSGANFLPDTLKFFAELVNVQQTGNVLSVDFRDVVNGITSNRRYTFTIIGNMLRIRVKSLDSTHTYFGAYSGYFGGESRSVENPRILDKIQGSIATPLVMFDNGPERWLTSNSLDLMWSNAADFSMQSDNDPQITANSIAYAQATIHGYEPIAGTNPSNPTTCAPLDESVNVIVTQDFDDAFVRSTKAPSAWKEGLNHRSVVLFAGDNSWAEYLQHFEQFKSWGMDDVAIYAFNWWSDQTYPQFYPGKDYWGVLNFGQAAKQVGVPFGVYTYYGPASPGSPLDLSGSISTDYYGNQKIEFNKPALVESAIGPLAAAEALQLKEFATASFQDVNTYAAPSKGGGDHISQNANPGHTRTMREAIIQRKNWLRNSQRTLGMTLGESSIATKSSSWEVLWRSYVDGTERCINFDGKTPPQEMAANDPDAPTSGPVIVDYELGVDNANDFGNGHIQRFLTLADGPEIKHPVSGLVTPLNDEASDRNIAYEISFGKNATLQTNGPNNYGGNYHKLADLVAHYYRVAAISYFYNSSEVASIEYLHNGQLKTLEQVVFETGTTDSLIDAKLKVVYQNGLTVFVNHGTSDWVQWHNGTQYVLPEDGYLAYLDALGFLTFSAKLSPGGPRFDYVDAKGQYVFMDGRGSVTSHGKIQTSDNPFGHVAFKNYASGNAGYEDGNTEIQVTYDLPPTTVGLLFLSSSSVLENGAELGIKAVGLMQGFGPGIAFRDVSTTATWSSSDPSVATVNPGGAVITKGPGVTTITASKDSHVATHVMFVLP